MRLFHRRTLRTQARQHGGAERGGFNRAGTARGWRYPPPKRTPSHQL
jgi:hypothetical protein